MGTTTESGSGSDLGARLRALGVDRTAVAWWGGVSLAEATIVLFYLQVAGLAISDVRYVVYPFVWINVGLWAAMNVETDARDRRQYAFALAVAGLYALALLYAGGLLRPLPAGVESASLIVRFQGTPGWTPLVVFQHPLVHLMVVPFKLVGYLALAYLVYARLLDATKGVVAGLLGLVSCVGCTFSVLLPLAGATALFGTAITRYAWDLSTLVYPLTVALLYWNEEVYRWARRRLPG